MNFPARIASDERGAVLTIVAVALAALILTVALVLDVANWKVHKRHLQLQADAAALAAAGSYTTAASCSNNLIATQAHNYGGPDANNTLALYNKQVGGTPASKMHILINSSGYFGDAGAGDNTDTNGPPCTAKYIDIKATETDLPWFMGFGGVVSRINAHARVSVLQQSSSNSTLPIAVPNPKPTAAGAIFINEATGAVLGTVPLGDVGVSGSLQMYASAAGAKATVQIATHTGVVIALSGRPAASFSLAGTLAQICQQQLTDCYDASADPPAQGLSHIRGFDPNASGAQPNTPKLRTVELLAGACSNSAYFSNNTTGCVYDIYARIDKGNLPNADVLIHANGAQLFSSSDAVCDSFLNQGGVGTCWHAQITLPAGSGPNNIKMDWEETSGCLMPAGCTKPGDFCKTGNGNKCTGKFEGDTMIQRAYSAKDTNTGFRSGPIKIVKIFRCDADPTCAEADHQSFPVDSTHTFAVSIGIAGILRNATSVNEPLVALRVVSNTGQSLDCDTAYTNLKDELAQGCRPSYVPNDGSVDCSLIGKNVLWAMNQPWPCVAVNTGRAVNDIAEGLNRRIYFNRKPPPSACGNLGDNGHNNWPNFKPTDPAGDGTYGFPQGDRRILDAYLTTYGAFSHVNGSSGSVPVTGFGHFYVTGYIGSNGQGFDPPCLGNGDDPVPNGDAGLIVGHFIYYLNQVGGDGTAPCDPTSINACVIVMTK
ncbi:MAG: pilus assembly protein TadG-related protein [Actinomycetota bacterium]|nr:pilus assembly protein TadG-related protein [Actinomycetota bacterium]